MARHYTTAILPARPFHPRDKPAVEASVLLVQRWILARLRHRQFFTLDALNVAISELLVDLNNRPFQKLDGCRRSVFEAIDRPAMTPLPTTRYEFAEWKKAMVGFDYHVDISGHYYTASSGRRSRCATAPRRSNASSRATVSRPMPVPATAAVTLRWPNTCPSRTAGICSGRRGGC